VLTLQVSVAGTPDAAPGRRAAFFPELLRRAAALPGVTATGAINHLPLAGDSWGVTVQVEGEPMARPAEREHVTYRTVMPGYFATMGIPLVRGRDVSAADDAGAPHVVVVNERFATEHWPGQDPVGKRISREEELGPAGWLTVVGVAKDTRQLTWDAPPRGEIYLPVAQEASYRDDVASHYSYLTVVARTAGDPAALAGAVRATVHDLSPGATVSDVATMTEVVREATSRPRFYLLLLAAFATLALVLAAVGIYGVMSYAVSRRSQEIGIRMALGAQRRDVVKLVVGQGVRLAVVGVAVGLAAAVGLTQLMVGLLYGVRPADPPTLVAVAVVLVGVAFLASFLPARRATRIDPMAALRSD